MRVSKFISSDNFKLRDYTRKEIEEEQGELERYLDEALPQEVCDWFRDAIDNVNSFENVDMPLKSKVDNCNAFGSPEPLELNSYEQDGYDSLKKAINFPPPIVLQYGAYKSLLGGNKRSMILRERALARGENFIPVKLIRW